jgi:hypothetical protein
MGSCAVICSFVPLTETVMEIMNPTEPLVLQVIPREDFVMAVVLEHNSSSVKPIVAFSLHIVFS